MDKHQIMEIMRDEDFVNEILDMQTTEEVKEAFAEKGLELSLEEIDIISQIINKMVDKNTTELSEEDLEEISGGSLISRIKVCKSAISNFKENLSETINYLKSTLSDVEKRPTDAALVANGIAEKIINDKTKKSAKWLKNK